MQEMVEPDRTILIVSIIGLVVIWGSVAYHKFVQDGAPAGGGSQAASQADGIDQAPASTPDPAPAPARPKRKGKGKR